MCVCVVCVCVCALYTHFYAYEGIMKDLRSLIVYMCVRVWIIHTNLYVYERIMKDLRSLIVYVCVLYTHICMYTNVHYFQQIHTCLYAQVLSCGQQRGGHEGIATVILPTRHVCFQSAGTHVYMFLYAYTHTHTCIHTFIHIRGIGNVILPSSTNMNIHTYTHTHTNTQGFVCLFLNRHEPGTD